MQAIHITRHTTSEQLVGDIIAAIVAIQSQMDTKDVRNTEIDSKPETSVTDDLQDASGLHVDTLTNAPIGYDIVERHPTEDFALYARQMGTGGVEYAIIIGGMLVASDNPVADFNTMRHFNQDQLVERLNKIKNNEPIEAPDTKKRFVGVYRKLAYPGEEEKLHLWAIYNTALVKVDYKSWLDMLKGAYPCVIAKDAREEFEPTLAI